MVLLTITPAAKAAIDAYCRISQDDASENELSNQKERFSTAEAGDQIRHDELLHISQYLLGHTTKSDPASKQWRLETLLKGSDVFFPPPPKKPEPTPEYKALMQRLREQEEQRQYERMLNPPLQRETFSQRFPNAATSFGSGISMAGYNQVEVDEVTYADVNRQMVLIMNVLVSIIACSVTIWMAARRWSIPQRLALSFFGSTVVAVAEVAIYMGYIRRIKEAKTMEAKKVEQKQVVDTWVIAGKSQIASSDGNDSLRFRKGKHR